MTVTSSIGYLKRWVMKAFEGRGFLKGSQCKVDSVTPIPSPVEPTVPTGKLIKLKWDRSESGSMTPIWTETEVELVDYGRQIYSITEVPAKRTGTELWFDVAYYDGSTGHFTMPMSAGGMKRKVVTSLPAPELADTNTVYLLEDPLSPGNYNQYITTYDEEAHKWMWLSLGSTSVDLEQYMKKIDSVLIHRQDYKNTDPATQAIYPTAPSVPAAINEYQDMISSTAKYDYTNSKITGLNTYHKTNIVSALNDMGSLSDLEGWDPTAETPATLVDAINIANKTYNLETQSVIDRTKYIDVKKLKVDNHDGTGYVQVGEDIKEDRVDLYNRPVPEASTSFVDYRTYDVRVANSFYDPNDATQNPYGAIHIPQIKLKKEQVYDDVVDTITPTAWLNPMPSDYEATVELTHVPVIDTVTPVVSVSPETGGSKSLVVTAGSKTATIKILGATTAPVASSTVCTITYKGESASVAARYYLRIEDKDYSEAISGAYIDIAKDSFLEDAGSGVVTEKGKPYPSAEVGDLYLWLRFIMASGDTKMVYIPLKDVVKNISGIKAIKVELNPATNTNEISLVLDTTNPANTLTQSTDGLKIATATNAQIGVERFATDAEVLSADSQFNAVRPFDIHEFVVKSTTVKDDLNNFYKDATTTEIVNNTVIKAVNELSTETITKNATADAKDVATYTYKRIPETGKEFALSTLHDLRQVWQTDKLSTIVNPQPYEIYYLNAVDGTYIPGLYVYDETKLAYVSVDGNCVLEVDALPTPGSPTIDAYALYRLKDYNTITARYKLSAAAVAGGYYINESGLYNYKATPVVAVGWNAVLLDWAEWIAKGVFERDETNGPVFLIEHSVTGVKKLVYNFVSDNGNIYHYFENAWHLLTVAHITSEDIANQSKRLRF